MIRTVNIQFHMLFDELIDFIREVSSRYQLPVELERFYPRGVREVPFSADLTKEIKQFGQVDRFWLLYTARGSLKADKFMLNFGGQRGNRLAQSQLGAGARSVDAFEVLRQVASALKKRTKAGLWVIAANGNVGYVKIARVSGGASKAARSGVIELVSSAFTQSYRVDPPEDSID